MCLDFDLRDNRRCTFSLKEELLWIIYLNYSQKKRFEVKSVLMLDLFQRLSSPDVVWCFYQTLILTAPIHFHCWDTDAETHFCKSDEDTNSISDDLREHFHFGWTLRLKISSIHLFSKPIFTVILQHWNTSSLQSTSRCCALVSIS